MMVLMLSNIEIKTKNQSAYAKSKICRAIDLIQTEEIIIYQMHQNKKCIGKQKKIIKSTKKQKHLV